jgi:hypothetical protein
VFNELMLASQSVQALGTLLKTANGLANYNEIVLAVSEVNSKLMQANATALASQERHSELIAKVAALQAEVQRLQDWTSVAAQYESVQVAHGVFAYLPKSRSGDFESTEKLCGNCFLQGHRSILQQSFEESRRKGLNCHRCKAKMVVNGYLSQGAGGSAA